MNTKLTEQEKQQHKYDAKSTLIKLMLERALKEIKELGGESQCNMSN